jgi:micrococcal nuclease
LLGCVSITSSIEAINKPEPITEKKLKQLGLDRKFHKCISVADGDTITLEDIGSVRVIGVDTSEKNHPKLPVQYWSKEASNFTRKLCLRKKVRLGYDPYDNDLRGKYGRVLGYVFLENGIFLQEELLKKGYAIAYLKFPFNEKYKAKFIKWEQMAHNKKIGLWQDDGILEARWIMKQKHKMIQITLSDKDKYELRYKDWTYKSIPIYQLESQVKELYRWIYEFSVRDLERKLEEANYYNDPKIKSNKMNVFVFGMAHKKWGIYCNKFVFPRIKSGDLDRKIEQLVGIINHVVPKKTEQEFLNHGYHYVGDLEYDPLSTADRLDNNQRFVEVTNTSDGIRVINWDDANEHIGEYLGIKGKIVRTHNSGKACFLNFHNNFTIYMSAVLFSRDFDKFPKNPEEYYLNKIVIIKGKIKEYKNKPEIILKTPTQIEIINSFNKKEDEFIKPNQKSYGS